MPQLGDLRFFLAQRGFPCHAVCEENIDLFMGPDVVNQLSCRVAR